MDETIWLTQKQLSESFDVGVPAINKHLKNIFETGELDEHSTISKLEIVRQEGNRSVRRTADFYNLDAIIPISYRVNSYQATQFRIWATKVLKEFLIKGMAA
ncbi:virulence RhuM family protein [Rubritalea spongiae]|uniref:Virulence RhuM family protein n=1 Tax=Rubritalea spongiae TaxID=430797 RepID=A0ABW5E3D3_9BACT